MVVLVGLIRGDQVGGVAATDATQFYPAHGMLRASRCPRQWAGIMPRQAPSERCKRGEFAGAGRQGFTVRNRGWTCHGKTAITDAAPRLRRDADADSVSFTPSRTSTTWPLPPPHSPRQPGQSGRHLHLRDQLRKGEESWDEQIDLTELLLAALQERDIPATRDEAWLRTGDGFWLLPQLVSAQLSEDGNMRTSTTIQAWHPELAPEGVFEYQHSISNEDAVSAFRRGFRNGPRRMRWRCATAPATSPTVPA